MLIISLHHVLLALSFYNGVRSIALPDIGPRATGSLNSYIASESPIALQGILDNIGADGSDAAGADPGIVIASPSKTNPDCTYNMSLFWNFRSNLSN